MKRFTIDNSPVRMTLETVIVICLIGAALLFLLSAGTEKSYAAGKSWSKAQKLTLGKEITANADTQDWEHYYYFTTTTADAFYIVDMINSSVDWYIDAHVYDSNKVKLDEYVSAGINKKDSDWWKLDKEKKYYIKVSGSYKGQYKLCVKEETDDASDDAGNALKINIGTQYEKTINVAGDTDWFSFRTGSKSSFYKISIINKNCDNRVELDLYDKDLVRFSGYEWSISAYSNRSNFMVNKLDVNSTYYLMVNCSDPGNYAVTVTREDDPAGEDYKSALAIEVGQKVKGRISCSSDEDWYVFTAPSTGEYYVKLDENASFTHYDSDANSLESYWINSSDKGRQDIGRLKNGRTYYLNVTDAGSKQDYSLTVCRKIRYPGKPEITVKAGRKSAKVTVIKASNAAKYEIAYRKGNGSWKYTEAKNITKKIKKLKSGKTYTFKVRAYSFDGGNYYAGKWSKSRKVKIK